MTNVLSLSSVQVAFNSVSVLKDINFSLKQGEILGLLGASGCGKTTLLNTIAGFIHQAKGEIKINEVGNITPNDFIEPDKRHVGMIFQDYALFPHLTMEENIEFGINKLTKVEKKQKVEQLIAILKLEGLNKHYPHELSGGQQQRVAIARALAPQPKLLLLDEPFSNIDARLRHDLIHELRLVLKALSISAIFVTHNKDEVFAFADKVAVMHQGHILQFGEPAKVCQEPTSFHVADFLQLGSFVPVLGVRNNLAETPLGSLEVGEIDDEASNNVALIRGQYFTIEQAEVPNAKVMQVSVMEQGFKLRLVVFEDEFEFEVTAFSDVSFQVDEPVKLTLLPHLATLLSR